MQKQLLREFELFVEAIDPIRTARNLRSMMMDFIQTEIAKESDYTNDAIYALERIFQILDVMEDCEMKLSQNTKEKVPSISNNKMKNKSGSGTVQRK